jgi:hypothetical protein
MRVSIPIRLLVLWLLVPAVLRAVPGVLAGQVVSTAPVAHRAGQYATVAGMPAAGARGVPVAGADVSLPALGRRTVTDAAGRFRFDDVPPGAYTLVASHRQFRDPTALQATAPGTVSVPLGVGYYLAVGIGRYQDRRIERLASPPRDVLGIRRVLFTAFPGRAVVLTDAMATKAKIRAAFTALAAHMQPQDFLIFYYTGHGSSENIDARRWVDSLLPVDSDKDRLTRDIRDEELLAWLGKLPDPRRVVVIMDSCYAGAFFTARKTGITKRVARMVDHDRLRTLGFTLLAAADASEEAVDTEEGSVFTNALLTGLTRQRVLTDADRDRRITADELFRFAAPRATSAARGYGERQHPQLAPGENPVLLRY